MTVTVILDLPSEIEKKIRADSHDLSAEVKEAYALELYRQEKINHYELSQMLGLDRFQTSALLQQHKIYVGSLTAEDLEADYRTINEVLGKAR